jgi:hypothetical protein
MLGLTTDESLKNCDLYDSLKTDIDKICKLQELIEACTDKSKVIYVRDFIAKYIYKMPGN